MHRETSAPDILGGNGDMKVFVPGPLRSYTHEKPEVHAKGTTIEEVLNDMDRQFPGLRFRIINEQGKIREHIKIFRNTEQEFDLQIKLAPEDVLHIIAALSGG